MKNDKSEILLPHQIAQGQSVRLSEMSTDGRDYCSNRKQAEEEFRELRDELIEWQRRMYAEGSQKLLIVLQAMDAGGKDGTIRKVFRGVNPQGVRVTSFKAPTSVELAHDFLWRVHQVSPATGIIGVFNRSHYEDVLIVRVRQLVPESVWRPRFKRINEFEKLLHESGTAILKFYLHVSFDEQGKRLRERAKIPEKHWKYSAEDFDKRQNWDKYMTAYEEVIKRCTTEHAAWHVIPADRKWYRNLAISRAIIAKLREMNPQFPRLPEGFRLPNGF